MINYVKLPKKTNKIKQQQKEERDVAIQRILKDPPPTLPVPEAKLSPTSLFLTFNDLDIAKQLTMIEFGIFSKIRVSLSLCSSRNFNTFIHLHLCITFSLVFLNTKTVF